MSADEAPTLRIERAFAATPERVFDAWTNPVVLRRWWAAQPDWVSPEAVTDLRVGGRYRLAMQDTATGEVRVVVGEYLEVERPRRLVYSWTWEGGPAAMAGSERTVVSVRFEPQGAGTRVVLEHRGFAGPQVCELHGHGWRGCLDALEARVLGGAAAG
jgi:uncharacterized protein YndB with AHSA1/START domain